MNRTPASLPGSSAGSNRAAAASAAPPRPTSRPCASRIRAPSAWSIPAPPSLDALPPRPSTISRAPAATASAITTPRPKVLAPSGSGCRAGSFVSPTTAASSTTAVSPRTA
ncbi:Uncharacterised protein [Mycobacteroides abscessus subsp. abscessus]|nr:Uncharacterised protein [Mycobacteroides abscessus subsp. abscessus]